MTGGIAGVEGSDGCTALHAVACICSSSLAMRVRPRALDTDRYFAAHAHGKGHVTDDVGVSTPAKEGIMQGNGARCDVGFPPCKDNKCYCCIGGRTHARYSTLAECSHACF
ncbi:maternally expressed gene3 [Zea mays]|uniref:Maternally expressed gene3 n=1 Tax=Zea mays TaxID=4577 RepID=A0A1D6HUD5_MAIZE|nr:maternally expressed gene3 [Zea mays]